MTFEVHGTRLQFNAADVSRKIVSAKYSLSEGDKNSIAISFFLAHVDNIEVKDKIIVIFPEKFNIENYRVRTTKLNEVVSLIYKLDAGFGGNENGTSAKKIDLSREVARPGFEPRQTEPKSVVLPLYYRAIRSFKRDAKIRSTI